MRTGFWFHCTKLYGGHLTYQFGRRWFQILRIYDIDLQVREAFSKSFVYLVILGCEFQHAVINRWRQLWRIWRENTESYCNWLAGLSLSWSGLSALAATKRIKLGSYFLQMWCKFDVNLASQLFSLRYLQESWAQLNSCKLFVENCEVNIGIVFTGSMNACKSFTDWHNIQPKYWIFFIRNQE